MFQNSVVLIHVKIYEFFLRNSLSEISGFNALYLANQERIERLPWLCFKCFSAFADRREHCFALSLLAFWRGKSNSLKTEPTIAGPVVAQLWDVSGIFHSFLSTQGASCTLAPLTFLILALDPSPHSSPLTYTLTPPYIYMFQLHYIEIVESSFSGHITC